MVFIVRKCIIIFNCLTGTPHDFITSLLIEYKNKSNKYINLLHQNPMSPVILQLIEKPIT